MTTNKPKISNARVPAFVTTTVTDENGATKKIAVTAEYPLTLYVDKNEYVTLMTLGQMPEALTIGWLRNQRLVESIADIEEVMVDWETNAAAIHTKNGLCREVSAKPTVTSGCGQGAMFGDFMADMEGFNLERQKMLSAEVLFDLLTQIRAHDSVYKKSGAVHACCLARQLDDAAKMLLFVEDVGRHNAVDTIAGWMWLNDITGEDKFFYTTGRLTSEMVIKCAQMGIPYLVSRSGMTRMGLEIAQSINLTVIGRAMNNRYLVFSGAQYIKH